MTIAYSYHDRFEQAAAAKAHCRIVYRDDHGEHHAVMAVPNEWREIDGATWAFFTSEAGEVLEVRLEEILAIELPDA
ncbi:MAG: hypothetical protein K9M17_07785 [Mariprofundaceae bacterium]|nr:hypothetical protein [Mariprofundaceae bacterium]